MATITKLVGELILFRHGQTAYTNQEFDLTPEGVETIRNTAKLLKQKLAGIAPIHIIHSPRPRAKTSALVLRTEMGDVITDVTEDRHISSIVIRDHEKSMALFKEHFSNGGVKVVDFNYLRDSRFNDPEICEPWDVIRTRFYWYLGRIIRKLIGQNIQGYNYPCHIFISHYELLCHFINDVFNLDYSKDETLKHGEVIHILVYRNWKPSSIELVASFRGMCRIVSFKVLFGAPN